MKPYETLIEIEKKAAVEVQRHTWMKDLINKLNSG